MQLLVDAGNTSVKWALAAPGAPLGVWQRAGACARDGAERLADDWRDLPAAAALVSNVAGADFGALLAAQARQVFGAALPLSFFASRPACGGVTNGYRDPGQLGCDRFAAAIGARALFPGQPLIVVHCGTATTVDALSAGGRFLGGMILPGLGLMTRALATNTAQLPQAPPQAVALDRFADNTVDAIASGCIAAQAGAIGRALALHARSESSPVRCVLAGGAAAWIAPHLEQPCERVDNLVLIGLQVAAMQEVPC